MISVFARTERGSWSGGYREEIACIHPRLIIGAARDGVNLENILKVTGLQDWVENDRKKSKELWTCEYEFIVMRAKKHTINPSVSEIVDAVIILATLFETSRKVVVDNVKWRQCGTVLIPYYLVMWMDANTLPSLRDITHDQLSSISSSARWNDWINRVYEEYEHHTVYNGLAVHTIGTTYDGVAIFVDHTINDFDAWVKRGRMLPPSSGEIHVPEPTIKITKAMIDLLALNDLEARVFCGTEI